MSIHFDEDEEKKKKNLTDHDDDDDFDAEAAVFGEKRKSLKKGLRKFKKSVKKRLLRSIFKKSKKG